MINHLTVGALDVAASKNFYDATLAALGYQSAKMDDHGRCFYRSDTASLIVAEPINGEPASQGNGITIAFKAPNPEAVDAWHRQGLQHGGVHCEDPPGIRERSGLKVYAAYLRDPAGNKVCATYRLSNS